MRPAVLCVAGDAAAGGPLLAKIANLLEQFMVQSSTELFNFDIFILEPDFVVPIDASVVHPLLRGELNHGALSIRTEHARGRGRILTFQFVLTNIATALTVPGVFFVRSHLVEITSMAAGMHNNKAQVANNEVLIFLPVETDVTVPILLKLVFCQNHRLVFFAEIKIVDIGHHTIHQLCNDATVLARWDLMLGTFTC